MCYRIKANEDTFMDIFKFKNLKVYKPNTFIYFWVWHALNTSRNMMQDYR